MDGQVKKIKIDIAEIYQGMTSRGSRFYSALCAYIAIVAGFIIMGAALYEGTWLLRAFIFIILLDVLGYFLGRVIDRKCSLRYFEKNLQDISKFITLEEVKNVENESFMLNYIEDESVPAFRKYFNVSVVNGRTYIHKIDEFKSEFSFDELIAKINRLLKIALIAEAAKIEKNKIEEHKKRENIDTYHALKDA